MSFNTTVRQMTETFQWPKCVSKNEGNVSAKTKPRYQNSVKHERAECLGQCPSTPASRNCKMCTGGDTTRFLGMWLVGSSHSNTVARVRPSSGKIVKHWPVRGYKRVGDHCLSVHLSNTYCRKKWNMVIRGIELTRKQPAAIRLTRRDRSTDASLHWDNWITIIRLWRLSQWFVTYGHHLAVIIYLHVAPSSGRHITSLSISLNFYHFIIYALTLPFLQVRLLQDDLQRRMLLRGAYGLSPRSLIGRHLLQLAASPWTTEISTNERWQFGH